MLRGLMAAATLPVLRLKPGGQAHPGPLPLIQLAIAVTVEASQQAGVVPLPFADDPALGGLLVEDLLAATRGAEITDGIQRLAYVETLLGVTVFAAAGEKAQQAAARRP